MNRYQQLAELFKQQIKSKTWRAGDRMPSVRAASQSHSVSTGTVVQAYQLLESQGWIIAKPQSGFFVTSRLDRILEPVSDQVLSAPTFNDTLFDFLKSHSQENTLKLGSAFPDPSLFPMIELNRSVASAGRKSHHNGMINTMPPGSENLRRMIAQRYIQQGMNLSHDDIVITSGALEALNLSMQAVTTPGDSVVLELPTFYAALQAVERLGLKVIPISVDAEKGVNLVELEKIFCDHSVKACWLMSNFQNPTGLCLSDRKKQKIVELAKLHQVYLIEDDVYGELYFSAQKPTCLKSFDNFQQERVLHCGSLSKSLCPGYRIGWVISRRFHQPIQKLQMMSTLSGSAPIQQGITHYLQSGSFDNHLRKLRKVLSSRMALMVKLLHQYLPDSVVFTVPKGGYFLWLKLPIGVSSTVLSQALSQCDVTIASGGLFANGGECDRYLRINASLSELPETERAIIKMSELICALETV